MGALGKWKNRWILFTRPVTITSQRSYDDHFSCSPSASQGSCSACFSVLHQPVDSKSVSFPPARLTPAIGNPHGFTQGLRAVSPISSCIRQLQGLCLSSLLAKTTTPRKPPFLPSSFFPSQISASTPGCLHGPPSLPEVWDRRVLP